MTDFKQTLLDMGFGSSQVDKALAATKSSSVQDAMEWIFSHPESAGEETGQSLGGTTTTTTPTAPAGGDKMEISNDDTTTNETKEITVHNALCDKCKEQICGIRYKCKECGDYDLCSSCYEMRLVYHEPEHEFAAHEKDIPMPERKPLTEEEKKAALERLKVRREEIRKQKAEEEARLERERELKRRASGKEAVEAQKKWKEDQMKRDAALKRKEKEDDKRAKAAIREKIERNKREREAKMGKAKPSPQASPSPQPQVPTTTPTVTTPAVAKEYDTCTVQVRLTTGATITKDFTPTDTLRAVHNWVATARTDQRGGFALSTAYPRKDYSGSALDSTTLKAADLVPRGSLMVKNL